MYLITWNVNGIRACQKKGFLTFLEKEDPDILCLQESKAHPDQLGDSLLHLPSRKGHWSSAIRRGYSGVVTFIKSQEHSQDSKQNLDVKEVSRGIGIRKFDSEGRFMITKHKDFTLYNVYFPNGSASEERHFFKQDFLRKFSRFLKREIQKGEEIILVGDYNVAHQDMDVFDPVRLSSVSGFLPEEREWFRNFLKLGFIDVFRHFYPHTQNCYSWWSYRENARKMNKGWRIDYICVTQGLLHRINSVKMMTHQYGSDHCPVAMAMHD